MKQERELIFLAECDNASSSLWWELRLLCEEGLRGSVTITSWQRRDSVWDISMQSKNLVLIKCEMMYSQNI